MEYLFGIRRDIWQVPSETGEPYQWEVWWIRKHTHGPAWMPPNEFKRIAGGRSKSYGEAVKIAVEWEVAAYLAGPKGTPVRKAQNPPREDEKQDG